MTTYLNTQIITNHFLSVALISAIEAKNWVYINEFIYSRMPTDMMKNLT